MGRESLDLMVTRTLNDELAVEDLRVLHRRVSGDSAENGRMVSADRRTGQLPGVAHVGSVVAEHERHRRHPDTVHASFAAFEFAGVPA